MSARNNLVTLVVAAVATAILLQNAAAIDILVVGDSLGWHVPSGGAAYYTNWTSQHTFEVGDILVFNFVTGQHTAAKVTKEAFDACNITNPLFLQTNGPANFTLNATGEAYYICTTSDHCARGQKLSINVTSNAESPDGSPSPNSPPTTPSDNNAPPPPPPPSSAPPTAIATFSPMIFMSIVIGFLY